MCSCYARGDRSQQSMNRPRTGLALESSSRGRLQFIILCGNQLMLVCYYLACNITAVPPSGRDCNGNSGDESTDTTRRHGVNSGRPQSPHQPMDRRRGAHHRQTSAATPVVPLSLEAPASTKTAAATAPALRLPLTTRRRNAHTASPPHSTPTSLPPHTLAPPYTSAPPHLHTSAPPHTSLRTQRGGGLAEPGGGLAEHASLVEAGLEEASQAGLAREQASLVREEQASLESAAVSLPHLAVSLSQHLRGQSSDSVLSQQARLLDPPG